MKRIFIPFPSIGRLNDLTMQIKRRFKPQFSHLEDGLPQFKEPDDMPDIYTFEGSVKGHGTNASVVLWGDDHITAQSRKRIVSLGSDNHGWANWVTGCGDLYWNELLSPYMPEGDHAAVIMYGEWIGGNIQTGVGVTGMEKAFIPFALRTIKFNPEFPNDVAKAEKHWLIDDFNSMEFPEDGKRIFHILEFPTYTFNLHLDDIDGAIDNLDKLMYQVEENCPIAKALNPNSENTIGEGIVWNCTNESMNNSKFWFKHKGEKHQRTGKAPKVPKPKIVLTDEQRSALDLLIKEAVTTDRLEQGFEHLNELGLALSRASTGAYIEWFKYDVLKECELLLLDCLKVGLEWNKHVVSIIAKSASAYYLEKVK